jgi:hypothetical protein
MPLLQAQATSATNAVATAEIPAFAGKRIAAKTMNYSYSGTPTGGRVTIFRYMPYTPLLDVVRNAYAAFYFKRQRSGHVGPCFRGRRAADNVEQDIGFNVDGSLDTASLLTFANGGTVHMKMWYDQTGNGRHFDVTTWDVAVASPIVESGVLVLDQFGNNGLKHDGANNAQTAAKFLTGATVHPTGNQCTVISLSQPAAGQPAFGHIYQGTNQGLYYGTAISGFDYILYKQGGSAPTPSHVLSAGGQLEHVITTTDLSTLRVNVWQNAQKTINDMTISTYTPSAQVRLGYSGANYTYKGITTGLVFYDRILTQDEMVAAWENAKVSDSIPTPIHVVCSGDSITKGLSPTQATYMQEVRKILPFDRIFQFLQDGVSGYKIPQMETLSTTPVTGIDNLTYLERSPIRWLMMWGGTNDISSAPIATPAATYDLLRSFIANRKATGKFEKIIGVTTIPRFDTTTTNNIFTYNALQRAGMAPGGSLRAAGMDHLIDLSTMTYFDADGDYNDTGIYNPDKIHPILAGYVAMAPGFAKLYETIYSIPNTPKFKPTVLADFDIPAGGPGFQQLTCKTEFEGEELSAQIAAGGSGVVGKVSLFAEYTTDRAA